MTNPITDIENKKANMDMGALGYQVYSGAKLESGNWREALLIAVAFYRGMFGASGDSEPEDGET